MNFRVSKDPEATLDYVIDWTAWLAGDTIVASDWTVAEGSGLVKGDDAVEGSARARVWLSGGDAKGPHAVINAITTAGGRMDRRTIWVTVESK